MKFQPHAASAKCNHRLIVVLSLAFLLHVGVPSHLNAQQANSLDDKLSAAIENNDIIAVEHLLREGANRGARGTNGVTPLMNAAERGSLPLVSLLLENGAKAGEKDEQGNSALSHASRGGFVRVVNLLARLSDIEDKNRALFAAVEGGPVVIRILETPVSPTPDLLQAKPSDVEESWTGTVEALLDNRADFEARNEDGSTPLIWAASFAQTDIVKLLVQHGASIHARDKRGMTAFIAGACECAVATMNSAYDLLEILLNQGADVNARSRDGTTALMNAASGFGGAAIVKLLLDNGADPKLRDHQGNTALNLAQKQQRADKVRLIKEALARTN